MNKDVYKTISKTNKSISYKVKHSKFYAYIYHVEQEADINLHLKVLKKEHKNANHFCYAYQLGIEQITYRYNDDGEPKNSAGKPIFNQIQALGLTNILLVVVRYFGGTKLGVGGLIKAYRTASKLVLKESKIVKKTILSTYTLTFGYNHLNTILKIIKQNKIMIANQKLNLNCVIEISVRKSDVDFIIPIFKSINSVSIKKIND